MAPDCSLTADCRFLKSIWHQRCAGCSVCQLTYPEQNRVKLTEGAAFLCLYPSLKVRLVSHGALSSLPLPLRVRMRVCACVNERMDGWAGGSSITAAAVYITTSASAGRPCEKPCARECRCLSQAGMGSATENGTCMRTVDGMRQTRGESVLGLKPVYREKTSYMAFT